MRNLNSSAYLKCTYFDRGKNFEHYNLPFVRIESIYHTAVSNLCRAEKSSQTNNPCTPILLKIAFRKNFLCVYAID